MGYTCASCGAYFKYHSLLRRHHIRKKSCKKLSNQSTTITTSTSQTTNLSNEMSSLTNEKMSTNYLTKENSSLLNELIPLTNRNSSLSNKNTFHVTMINSPNSYPYFCIQ